MSWLAQFGPWKLAAQAEQRAAIAEERAAQSEIHCAWIRTQFERAEADKDRSTKILANVFAEMRFGAEFRPFPEVLGLPPERESGPIDQSLFDTPSTAVEMATEAFKLSELQRYEKMYAEVHD